MSLKNQRILWIIGILYFFIGAIIFFFEGSYLGWISTIISFLLGVNILKVNKEFKNT